MIKERRSKDKDMYQLQELEEKYRVESKKARRQDSRSPARSRSSSRSRSTRRSRSRDRDCETRDKGQEEENEAYEKKKMEKKITEKAIAFQKTIEPNIASKAPSSPEKLAFKTPSSPRKMSIADRTPIKLEMGESTNLKKISEDFPYVNTQRMTKSELSTLMMKLLKTLALKGAITLRQKPEWWPSNVEWGVTTSLKSDELLSVIRQCYKAYGKENMIGPSPLKFYNSPAEAPSPKAATACRMVTLISSPEVLPASPVKSRGFPKELYLPFTVEIFICYFCEKEFVSKDKMRLHQKLCDERPPDLAKSNYISINAEMDTANSPPQISPKPPNLKLDIDRKFVPLKQFAGYLGLIPSQTASKIKAERKCSEISCEILEEIEQPMSPVTSTPRTPKSLISQLSREDSGGIAKKRLSYSLSMDKDKVEEKEVFLKEEEASDSEAETEAAKPKSTNLLNIPISSLLGQKIQKYVHIDLVTPVLNNSESFCKTPTKNNFLEKLRKKPTSYPITYKPRRIANIDKNNHLYKFNKVQMREFLGKLKNGLNSESQGKLKLLKKLSIRVPRLSEKAILKWMPRQRMERQLFKKFKKRQLCYKGGPDEFPAGPTLLSKNIDKLLGLKKRSSVDSHSLSLSNYVSEEMEAEVSKLQLALYKCLLYEMSILKPTVLVSNVQRVAEELRVDEIGTLLPGHGMVPKNSPDKQKCSDEVKSAKTLKQDRSVLRNLLLKQTEVGDGQEKQKDEDFLNVKVDRSSNAKMEKQSNIKEPVVFHKTSTQRKASTSRRIGSSDKKSLCSPDVKSQCDDCLSVISLSSDSESFSSECCMNCKGDVIHRSGKEALLVNFHSDIGSDIKSKPLNPHTIMEPLTITVGDSHRDLLLQKEFKANSMGGVSPATSFNESLTLCTPPSTPSKSSLVDVSPQPNVAERQTRSTRSAVMPGKTSHCASKQPECQVDKEMKTVSTVKDVVSKRVKSLRHSNRSQSLTPSNSSKKNSLKTSVSLPCTPQKKDSERLKQVMESGRVLRGSQPNLQSLQISPVKLENPYALNSGNFIVSTSPTRLSPQKSVQGTPLFKSISPQKSVKGTSMFKNNSSQKSVQGTPMFKSISPQKSVQGTSMLKNNSSQKSVQGTSMFKNRSPQKSVQGTPMFKNRSPQKSVQVNPQLKKLKSKDISTDIPATRSLKRLRSSNSGSEGSPLKSKRIKIQ